MNREIIFEVFQLCDHSAWTTWTSRTDRRTGGITALCSIIA